jgi:cytochrome c553
MQTTLPTRPTLPALITLAALVAGVAGCANPERSRDLGNPAVSAQVLAQQVCSNCHGLNGSAVSPNFPNLAAQTAPYVVAQLNGFRGHSRQDPAGFEYMWGISHRLTDAQVAGLAAYYAAQTPSVQPLEGEPKRIAAGQGVFQNGIASAAVPACASCHGAQGQGNATFPRLAGQHADYVVKQLGVFQRTDQRPEGAVMKVVAHGLTREDMRNVAAYVQSLQSR